MALRTGARSGRLRPICLAILLPVAMAGCAAGSHAPPEAPRTAAVEQPDAAPAATPPGEANGAGAAGEAVPVGQLLGPLVIGNEVWRQCAAAAGRTLPAGAEDHFWQNYQLVAQIIAQEMEAGRFVPPRATEPMPPMSREAARMEVQAAAGRAVAASEEVVRRYGCDSDQARRLMDLHEYHAARWAPAESDHPPS